MKKHYLIILLLPFLAFVAGNFFTRFSFNKSFSKNNVAIKAADLPYNNSIETNSVKEFDLQAAPSTIELNGNEKFETWAYNNQVPGPEFRVQKGDTVKINFTNNLPQETTIHFHGIRVSNEMDGVPDVTQNPIKPGDTFTYEFVVYDAGTFWYHPHVRGNEQVERGLYGTLIVEDPNEPLYSQDKIIVLDDWRIQSDGSLNENFNSRHDIGHDGRWGNVITANGQVQPSFILKQNERVRYRLVNTSNARVYSLYFGELDVKAIAVDGILVREPFNPNGFDLAPGNRIDIDIKAPNKTDIFTIKDKFTTSTNNVFSIQISEEKTEMQNFEYPRAEKYPDMNVSNYIVDQEYALDQGGMSMMHNLRATINSQSYPDYKKTSLESDMFQVIRFSNSSARLHPMHLHGQFFKVIAKDGKQVDEPFMRDTVLVDRYETVDVGIIPIDEGDWALHCHILEHAEAGMMTIVEVD